MWYLDSVLTSSVLCSYAYTDQRILCDRVCCCWLQSSSSSLPVKLQTVVQNRGAEEENAAAFMLVSDTRPQAISPGMTYPILPKPNLFPSFNSLYLSLHCMCGLTHHCLLSHISSISHLSLMSHVIQRGGALTSLATDRFHFVEPVRGHMFITTCFSGWFNVFFIYIYLL